MSARAVILAALAAALALPAAADARSRYCTPSGDFCKATFKHRGKRIIELRSAAQYAPPETYRLCVRDPRRRETCKTFRLRPRGKYRIHMSRVTWSAHFPTNGGRGTYRVRWDDDGLTYGPPLTFKR